MSIKHSNETPELKKKKITSQILFKGFDALMRRINVEVMQRYMAKISLKTLHLRFHVSRRFIGGHVTSSLSVKYTFFFFKQSKKKHITSMSNSCQSCRIRLCTLHHEVETPANRNRTKFCTKYRFCIVICRFLPAFPGGLLQKKKKVLDAGTVLDPDYHKTQHVSQLMDNHPYLI